MMVKITRRKSSPFALPDRGGRTGQRGCPPPKTKMGKLFFCTKSWLRIKKIKKILEN